MTSEDVQKYLEFSLRHRLKDCKSLEYEMTWKRWDMQSGLPICALRARERRTSAKGCTGSGSKGLIAGYPSPNEDDANNATRASGQFKSLVRIVGWATPAHRDYRYPNSKPWKERGGGNKGEQLPNQVAHLGMNISLENSETEKSGVFLLNPRFSLWLMGYPDVWASCGALAMRSSRKLRPNLLEP